MGSRRSAKSPRPNSRPAAAGKPPGFLRIRRSPVRFAPLSRRLRRASFFERQRKSRKKPLKGTYFEAVPLRIPPRRPRGLRPHWIPYFWTKDERRGFGRRYGLPQPLRGFAMTKDGGPLRRGRGFSAAAGRGFSPSFQPGGASRAARFPLTRGGGCAILRADEIII